MRVACVTWPRKKFSSERDTHNSRLTCTKIQGPMEGQHLTGHMCVILTRFFLTSRVVLVMRKGGALASWMQVMHSLIFVSLPPASPSSSSSDWSKWLRHTFTFVCLGITGPTMWNSDDTFYISRFMCLSTLGCVSLSVFETPVALTRLFFFSNNRQWGSKDTWMLFLFLSFFKRKRNQNFHWWESKSIRTLVTK